MPSCNTNRLNWVSLTLDEGYLLIAAPPDLQRGIAPLGPQKEYIKAVYCHPAYLTYMQSTS